MGLFKKKSKDDSVEAKKNWYADRYQTVVVQRNFLMLTTVACIAGIIFSVLSVVSITVSKTIEPFVIEVEEKTGITNVIRPLRQEKYEYDETLRRYFLTEYITKRESYNYMNFERDYFTIVRLLSEGSVYAQFRATVSASDPNSPVRLGQTQRTIKIISMVGLKPAAGQVGFVEQIRFKSEDGNGTTGITNIKHKVATINFTYSDLVLTDEERAINPLGFQVIGYRVDDEVFDSK